MRFDDGRSGGVGVAGVAGVAGAMVLATAARVAAADLETITVDEHGPNKAVPTDAAFYLTGDVDLTVREVQVLIVRTGSPTVFRNHGERCEVVASRLNAGSELARLGRVLPGTTTADHVWRGGSSTWT